ncbi:MAG: V-type ATP synthase subunit E [Synergistaceae bacterium]|nr:V-type ATP synthase subunit E [Synergistaceae bacterium]
MSLAQITEKIRNDAQKEADEILSKAKGQADFITQKAGQECDEIKADFDARFEAERPEIIRRREIVANLDVEKMLLRSKRALIVDVYSEALEGMKALPKDKYLDFCARLLDEGVSSRDEKVIVGADEKYLDREWLEVYNRDHDTRLELSEERADISGGFILTKDRISINCSWDMLLKVLQEKQESDVVKRLFPSE